MDSATLTLLDMLEITFNLVTLDDLGKKYRKKRPPKLETEFCFFHYKSSNEFSTACFKFY